MRTAASITRRCFAAVAGFFIVGAGSVLLEPLSSGVTLASEASTDAASRTAEAPLVQAKLVSAQTSVTPGEALPIGVALTVAPGWHIYWLHPGDAGMSTQVEWKPSSGVRIDGVRWPSPTRFISYETIHANGYDGEVLLPATLTLTDIKRDKVALSATVRWLACQGDCVKGSATVSLDLPTRASAGGTVGETDDAPRLAAAEALVPRALSASDPFQLRLIAPATACPGDSVGFEVEARATEAETAVQLETFFLNAQPGQVVEHEERLSPTHLRIKTSLTDPAPGIRLADGVVVVRVTRAGVMSKRYVQLEFPTKLEKKRKCKGR